MNSAPATVIEPDKPAFADGKRRLIDAALRLAARGAGLSALGLRELAREAGLNHNTFYRHFAAMEHLGQAAAEEIALQLLAGMKSVRDGAARHADATVGTVDYFMDYVAANPDVFIVGARELHSAQSPMRAVLRKTLEKIAGESVEEIAGEHWAPINDRAQLFQVTLNITHYMLCRALDILDAPGQRAAIRTELINYVQRQFMGAMALEDAARAAASQHPQSRSESARRRATSVR